MDTHFCELWKTLGKIPDLVEIKREAHLAYNLVTQILLSDLHLSAVEAEEFQARE